MKTRINPLSALACLLLLASCARGDVLASLANDRSWIGYSPRNYNPNTNQQPSETSLRADLQQLFEAGWRNLYTYTLDGTQREVPRIAKEVGFENVLAGVFYFNEAQLNREKAAAEVEDPFIDGYIVGNEGLLFGRYNGPQLLAATEFFAGFGKPITTTEVGGAYLQVPELLDVGAFATINIQPWFNGGLDPFDPVAMARAVRDEYVAIKALRPDRLIVIKEAWWPTAAHPAATEANQTAFFAALANETDAAGDPLLFTWGESYDQPWKTGEQGPFATLGPDWGFYEPDGTPKQIVAALADTYTDAVPVNYAIGDYNRDGQVNAADYDAWSSDFGATRDIAGTAADGARDRVINAADYTVWRDAQHAAATSVPEPTAAALTALLVYLFALRPFRFAGLAAGPSDFQTRRA